MTLEQEQKSFLLVIIKLFKTKEKKWLNKLRFRIILMAWYIKSFFEKKVVYLQAEICIAIMDRGILLQKFEISRLYDVNIWYCVY